MEGLLNKLIARIIPRINPRIHADNKPVSPADLILKAISVTLITALLITIPGIAPYQVLAAAGANIPSSAGIKAEISRIPPAHRPLVSQACKNIVAVGVAPKDIKLTEIYDYQNNKLTDVGTIFYSDEKVAVDVRAIWKDLISVGMDYETVVYRVDVNDVYDLENKAIKPYNAQSIKIKYAATATDPAEARNAGQDPADENNPETIDFSDTDKKHLRPIYAALEELGVNDFSIISIPTLYDSKEGKLTNNGKVLISDSPDALSIKQVWVKMLDVGLNPFDIRVELLYNFNEQEFTPYYREIINLQINKPEEVGKVIVTLNAAFEAAEKFKKGMDPKEYNDALKNIFDSLDFIKDESPQISVTASWLEDLIAPGFRYSTGIIDENGDFQAGQTRTLEDGRMSYIELERGMPVRLIVLGAKDKVTGKQEINSYQLGFDKRGKIVPIGFTNTKLIQLMPGGAFVKVGQTKTTAKELDEALKESQEKDHWAFRGLEAAVGFVGNTLFKGPASYLVMGLGGLVGLGHRETGIALRKWGAAGLKESYGGTTNFINNNASKIAGFLYDWSQTKPEPKTEEEKKEARQTAEQAQEGESKEEKPEEDHWVVKTAKSMAGHAKDMLGYKDWTKSVSEHFGSRPELTELTRALSTKKSKKVLIDQSAEAKIEYDSRPYRLAGMDDDLYFTMVANMVAKMSQTDGYDVMHDMTGPNGYLNNIDQIVGLKHGQADWMRSQGFTEEADALDKQADWLELRNKLQSIAQTVPEFLVIGGPIAKGIGGASKLMTKAVTKLGRTPRLSKLIGKAPHLVMTVGILYPMTNNAVKSYYKAEEIKMKKRNNPDAMVGQDYADLSSSSREAMTMVVSMAAVTALGVGLGLRARGRRNAALKLEEAKKASEIAEGETPGSPGIKKLLPEDVTSGAVKKTYEKMSEVKVEVKNPDGTAETITVKIDPRTGQFKTTETLVGGENVHAETASGKSLSGMAAQATLKELHRAKHPQGKAPATETIVPDSANATQMIETGGIEFTSGKTKHTLKYTDIAKQLDMELVNGDALVEAYKKGDTAPLIEAYESGKDLVFTQEGYGHMTNVLKADASLLKTVENSVGSVLADELHGILTKQTNFIIGDGKTSSVKNMYKANRLVSRYEKLWKDLNAVKPKKVNTPADLLKTNEPAVTIDPNSGRVLKNKALVEALKKKGSKKYKDAEIDDMLTAKYTPEAKKPWTVDTKGKNDTTIDPKNAKLFPKGESGIMRESIFSSKALEVGAYLREGIKPGGKVSVNNTLASSTLLEALAIRKNANISGMSGSLLAVEEMIQAGIGSGVRKINTENAAGKREAPISKSRAIDRAHHVENIANDTVTTLKKGRGAIIFDLDNAFGIKDALKRKSPGTKVYEITDLTSDAKILEIADNLAKENAVVITNKRGIQGIDYKGNVDILANVDHLNAFELTQIIGRGARTKGTVSNSYLYHTAKTTAKIADLFKSGTRQTARNARNTKAQTSNKLKNALIQKLENSKNSTVRRAIRQLKDNKRL
ncbi:hypothetical protein ACFL6Y_07860, partial [Elusimicrobiota bacterium]